MVSHSFSQFLCVYVCVSIYDFSLLNTFFKVNIKYFHFLGLYNSHDNEIFKDTFFVFFHWKKKSFLTDLLHFASFCCFLC